MNALHSREISSRARLRRLESMNVASLIWQRGSQLHTLQAKTVRQLGHSHRVLYFDEPIPADTDVVLVQGPYGTLVPLVKHLTDLPPRRRPVLAYWFQQSLDMRQPVWFRELLAHTFSDLYRHYTLSPLHRLFPDLIATKGRRLGFLGDILWLHRNGLLDLLILSSTVYAEYLSRHGIPSLLVPRGYHPNYGSLLNRERDIAVVWMGKLRTKRRARAVHWLQEELERRGHTMRIYDGERHDFIFGEERTEILNRTRFVLNVFFSGPTDELSIRYYIAAANGATVITEPGHNRYPFVPGEHLVECPIAQMPDTIEYYVRHEEERQALAENMLRFMKEELTLEQSLATLLTQAEYVMHERLSRTK